MSPQGARSFVPLCDRSFLAGPDANLPNGTPPVIAFATSFPASHSGARVKYSVNNIFWELEYGGID